jgi:hypothetical protein
MATSAFTVPDTIEETVAQIVGLKGATRTAIGGARVLGPHIANQVAALYELAGMDESTADAMADGIRNRAAGIEEQLEIIRQELASIGGMVATAVRAHEEHEAQRKVTAAKAGTRTRSTSSSGTLNV